ncbi:type I secretion system permease/ATPase [Pantoea sp. 1.19]|uniref:type I secretion system permease/ATPase n=1 Tax=Pantoea sp. 1.19 TaxID=1925589 RepID=UPI00094892CF|nr:type I secretion system permease/ATPase [Pantoea sp. 1.19]
METLPWYEPWLQAMLLVAGHYRLDYSPEHIRVTASHAGGSTRQQILEDMARQCGLGLHRAPPEASLIDPWRLPLLAELDNGQVAVIARMDSDGQLALQFSGDGGLETPIDRDKLASRLTGLLVLRPLESTPDARVDDYIKPYEKNWFWQLALKDWRRYGDIMLVAMVANVLALSGMIFSMQVYDRVVPSQSVTTLWVLFAGVMMAILFEFIMRMLRVHIADVVGKRADLRISERVFAHALRIKNGARSKSTGSFIAQIRELESVRELITSTTIAAVTDLPFFLLFVAILWLVGGPLVLVVLLAVPLLLIPGLLIQRPLAALSSEGMRESAIRNATLVEAVQGIDDIKLLRAEQRFQNQWNHTNAVAANVSMKQRWLTGLLMTWTQEVQSIVYATVLLIGCYLVMAGDMTTGALVGTSILASRTIAPLAQISGVLSRWQSAKVARKGLDDLMQRPIDAPQQEKRVHKAHLRGDFQLRHVAFYYDEEEQRNVVTLPQLSLRAGERVAVLGRNGSGKSTLLQLLAGMQSPQQGSVQLDDIALPMLDPADLRRDVQLLGQQARLFYGSIRDNITLGNPQASDAAIQQALQIAGALPFVRQARQGLNEVILEGGNGLSGGQRQALLLARTLLTSPTVLLLDEPTASLDEIAEQQFIQQLRGWLTPHRTLVVATHRLPILALVDRIIVLDGGKIVRDGPREAMLNEQGITPPTRTVTLKRSAPQAQGETA